MRKDDVPLYVVLFLDTGKVSVQFTPKHICAVLLTTVLLVRAGGLTEVLWVGSQKIDDRDESFSFTEVQKIEQNKVTHLPHDQLTVVLKFTDYTNFSQTHAEGMTSVPVFESRALLTATPLSHNPSSSALPYIHTSSNADDLPGHLSELLEQETFSDFRLRVGNDTIPAHKCILSARSPVFRALLSSPMVEASTNEVPVPDFDLDTVRRLVRYLYTGSLPDLDPSNAPDLFSAADKYGVLSLRDRCSSVLVSSLSPQTACRALSLSDRHSDDSFKEHVMSYIRDNEHRVFSSAEWKDLMSDDPVLALEVSQYYLSKRLKMEL